MPFIASCPFCTKSGVPTKTKLSRKKIGASIQCRECGNYFTAVPPDDAAPVTGIGPSTYRPAKVQIADARMPDSVEAVSPKASADNQAIGAGPGPMDPAPAAHDLDTIPGWINIWGVAAFFLTSLALVLASTGIVRSVAIPLAGLGFLVCLLGFPFTRKKKAKDLIWLTGSGILTVTFLLVAILCPHVINRFWGMDFAVPVPDAKAPVLVSRDNRVTGPALSADRWVDAEKQAVRQGDLHIRVESVKADLAPVKNWTKDKALLHSLLVSVRVSNVGQLHRYSYKGFAGPADYKSAASGGDRPSLERPSLRDSNGKEYALRHFPGLESAGRKSVIVLKPLQKVQDLLIFEPPQAGSNALSIDHLDLELPASAWGGTGRCKLRIPISMVGLPPKE